MGNGETKMLRTRLGWGQNGQVRQWGIHAFPANQRSGKHYMLPNGVGSEAENFSIILWLSGSTHFVHSFWRRKRGGVNKIQRVSRLGLGGRAQTHVQLRGAVAYSTIHTQWRTQCTHPQCNTTVTIDVQQLIVSTNRRTKESSYRKTRSIHLSYRHTSYMRKNQQLYSCTVL